MFQIKMIIRKNIGCVLADVKIVRISEDVPAAIERKNKSAI